MKPFQPHWTKKQQARLATLMEQGVWIGYWCSDSHGRPSNGGQEVKPVRPGLVQKLKGLLPSECGIGAYHATRKAHYWKGSRVWMVALHGKIIEESNKAWSLEREILGEIYPEEACFDARVAVRLGIKELSGVNLSNAELSRADLAKVNLMGANLSMANLSQTSLFRADLRGADLSGSFLPGANLSEANLLGADLLGSNLSLANLVGVNLSRANLHGANLCGAMYDAEYLDKLGWQVNPNGIVSKQELTPTGWLYPRLKGTSP